MKQYVQNTEPNTSQAVRKKNEHLFPFLCPLSCTKLQREAGKKSKKTELDYCESQRESIVTPIRGM